MSVFLIEAEEFVFKDSIAKKHGLNCLTNTFVFWFNTQVPDSRTWLSSFAKEISQSVPQKSPEGAPSSSYTALHTPILYLGGRLSLVFLFTVSDSKLSDSYSK